MCDTGWKKVLSRCGRSQRSTAQALNVNITEMNMVAQGRAFLTPEKFDRACELLGCRPTEVYSDEVLAFMYGRTKEQARKRGLRVELEPKQQEWVEQAAELAGKSKSRIVNEAIEYKMLVDAIMCGVPKKPTRRIEHV